VAKEHLIVVYFCGDSPYFCHIRNLSIPPPLAQISTKQVHTTSPVIWRQGALRLNGRRRDTGGKRGGGSYTPVVVKFPLFSTKVKIYTYLSLLLEFLVQKSAPGIASDVATRHVALERAPEGHWRRQRRWQTTSMVSDSVSKKKISRNASGTIAIFIVTLAQRYFWVRASRQ
jgi:hypothetical protein